MSYESHETESPTGASAFGELVREVLAELAPPIGDHGVEVEVSPGSDSP